ncbi:MAG: sulfatase-like hydrolase/transferase, partial [Bacteroidota bacterium]
NTIVIFMSDHGHSMEERAFRGGGFAGPYRGSKMSLFEGGIRVPFVVSWPNQLEKGATRDQFCMSMDLLPTIAEWCQVENIPAQVEGKSIRMVMEDSKGTGRNQGIWKLGRQWAIRQGDWKLIGNPRDPTQKYPLDPEKDQLFLVNLNGDITESQNYAEQYPDKVDELIKTYLEWSYASPDDIPKKLPPLANKAVNASIDLRNKPTRKYSAQGGNTLIDNKRGTIDFTDGRWLGFLKVDLDAEINLKQTLNIDQVTVRCMQDQGNYIFIPKVIEIQYSEDGTNYSAPVTFTPDQNIMRQNGKIYDFQIPIKNKARYLKVRAKNIVSNPEWHAAKGADSYLFVDEIIVY